MTHHLRLAIVGDISAWTAESGALRDFVYEANRGQAVWFVDDIEGLDFKLLPQGRGATEASLGWRRWD